MGNFAPIRCARIALAIALALSGLGAPIVRADSTGGTAAPDGTMLAVRPATLLGQAMRVRGTLSPGASVLVQRLHGLG
jgi:hypothetical protein